MTMRTMMMVVMMMMQITAKFSEATPPGPEWHTLIMPRYMLEP